MLGSSVAEKALSCSASLDAQRDLTRRPVLEDGGGAVKPGDISSVTGVLAIAKPLQRHASTQE